MRAWWRCCSANDPPPAAAGGVSRWPPSRRTAAIRSPIPSLARERPSCASSCAGTACSWPSPNRRASRSWRASGLGRHPRLASELRARVRRARWPGEPVDDALPSGEALAAERTVAGDGIELVVERVQFLPYLPRGSSVDRRRRGDVLDD